MVDLTALTGAHVTVATLLSRAEEGVPPGKKAPFKPGERSADAMRAARRAGPRDRRASF